MVPMSWDDCFRAMNHLAGRTRLSWPQEGSGGFNCHEDFTISDIMGGAAWMITAPGDMLLSVPSITGFLELDTPVVGHEISWILGFVIILPFALIVASMLTYAAEDRERRRIERL